MMKTKYNVMLGIIGVLLTFCAILSTSYAMFEIGPTNTVIVANMQIPTCVGLSYSDINSLSIQGDKATPISDAKAISTDAYVTYFTINNSCNEDTTLSTIALAFDSTSSMPEKALKYSIREVDGPMIQLPTYVMNETTKTYFSEQVIKETEEKVFSTIKEEGSTLYRIPLGKNESKSFKLYLWIDENEGSLGSGATLEKNLKSYLFITDFDTISK